MGYVNDEASLLANYAKLGPAQHDYVILPENISTEPLAIGIKKGEANLKRAVDDALRELESSGQANQLFLKWYGPASPLHFEKRQFRIDSDRI